MIGITRRILDGILLQQNKKALTHEVLPTLMAEVSAVINSRPITTISSDPTPWSFDKLSDVGAYILGI
jgi:hypothetical protein